MSVKIYFDTDCFHHIARTFKDTELSGQLRGEILISPMTMIEALSHLARHWGQDVLEQINGMQNWLQPDAIGVLPFMSEAISIIGFGATITEDGYTSSLQDDMNVCRNATLDEVYQVADKRDRELIEMKESHARSFQDCVDHFRATTLTEANFTEAWLSRYRGNQWAQIYPKTDAQLVETFSALHEFEWEKLSVAVRDPRYKVANHVNDLFDAEQLIYVGDPDLHFITLDKGYLSKIKKSSQRARIHQVTRFEVRDPPSVEKLLREILE